MTVLDSVKVGDLVICKYDFDYYYLISFPYRYKDFYYIGIILAERPRPTIFLDTEMHYEVLCLDGEKRFFTPNEVSPLLP